LLISAVCNDTFDFPMVQGQLPLVLSPCQALGRTIRVPEPWLVGTTKVYLGVGADIVYENITLKCPARGHDECYEEWLLKKSSFLPNSQNSGDTKCPEN
jgi:hypothetical protein